MALIHGVTEDGEGCASSAVAGRFSKLVLCALCARVGPFRESW